MTASTSIFGPGTGSFFGGFSSSVISLPLQLSRLIGLNSGSSSSTGIEALAFDARELADSQVLVL